MFFLCADRNFDLNFTGETGVVEDFGRNADFPLLISLQTPDHQTRAMYELTIRST
jgi:hypothetical protein